MWKPLLVKGIETEQVEALTREDFKLPQDRCYSSSLFSRTQVLRYSYKKLDIPPYMKKAMMEHKVTCTPSLLGFEVLSS